jgi:uncharacterized protein YceH (UPF0502 family)
MTMRLLTETEARVLATLMEKARTVPDSYPMTLNAIVNGCNQKSNREPLMQVTDASVQEALDSLRALSLVFESSGGRVMRYEHNFERGVGVPGAAAALLGLLMLRGPQTAGELRIHSERWHRFADISSVEAFLDELQERGEEKGGPLVRRLPRAPGARESRWAHLMCGASDRHDQERLNALESSARDPSEEREDSADVPPFAADLSALRARVADLETEMLALKMEFADVRDGLRALSHPGQDASERAC